MQSSDLQPTTATEEGFRAPIGRLALGAFVAPLVIGGLFTLAAASQANAPDAGRSALFGLLAGLVGAAAGIAVVYAASPRPASTWPLTLLFASGVRMLGGLAVGLPLFMITGVEKMAFWGVFLAAALIAIIGEVAALGSFLRSLSTTPSAAEAPSA
ncbi:MAG: hypothetical protein AAGI53_08320 [Planctomycetota bacterium]